jgi:hypothetical protein
MELNLDIMVRKMKLKQLLCEKQRNECLMDDDQ